MLALNGFSVSNVHFKQDTVEIGLEDKKTIVLANNTNMNSDGWIKYAYKEYFPTINFHKVASEGYENHGTYYLINGRNGRRNVFEESEPFPNEIPWITQKYTPYIAVSKGGGHGPSNLSIYTVTDSIKFSWETTAPKPECWEFGKVIWRDTTEFKVEKIFARKANGYSAVYENVRLIKGKWSLGETLKFDSQCKPESPKN
jgi:hypothetical protein